MMIEHKLQNFFIDQTFETFLKWGHLERTLLFELVLNKESHKFLSVVDGHWDLFATFYKLYFLHFTELFEVHSKHSTDNFL